MTKQWSCTAVLLLLLLVMTPACRRMAPLEFNAEALIFAAVLLPPDANPVKAEPGALPGLLPGLTERHPDWAAAAGEARRLLKEQGHSLKLDLVGPDQLRFPEPKYLAEFGVGFEQPDVLRCAASGKALQLVLTCDAAAVGRAYPAVQALVLALAEESHGYVYDVNSKLLFTPAEYARSLFSKTDFALARHVSIQQYSYRPGRLRLVTLGLAKFGCPELEMRDFPVEHALACRHLVAAAAARLMADHLAEPAGVALPAELPLGFDGLLAIRQPVSLDRLRKAPASPLKVALAMGESDEGDPQENVVRLSPPADFKGDDGQWVAGAARALLGFEEKLDYAQSAEIPAQVRQQFQETFPRFREAFAKPRQDGERFYVKFRYELEGTGVELLWAELIGWTGSGLDTRLVSEPVLVKSLTAGKPVLVAEADVVDWMIRRADGSVQGNLTGGPAKEGGLK